MSLSVSIYFVPKPLTVGAAWTRSGFIQRFSHISRVSAETFHSVPLNMRPTEAAALGHSVKKTKTQLMQQLLFTFRPQRAAEHKREIDGSCWHVRSKWAHLDSAVICPWTPVVYRVRASILWSTVIVWLVCAVGKRQVPLGSPTCEEKEPSETCLLSGTTDILLLR